MEQDWDAREIKFIIYNFSDMIMADSKQTELSSIKQASEYNS